MGDEYLVHILGRLSSIWLNLVYSRQIQCFLGQFQFSLGFLGDLDRNLESSAPGVYHSLWPPDPDEGSPTGHLWWSLMGGEVTYMCHISRGRCEP